VAGVIFAIIVLQIVLQSIIAAVTRHRITDERDKLIQLRGYRAGYLTLASLMVVGLGMLWLHTHVNAGEFPVPGRYLAMHFLNVFFGMLVISDVVKTVAQIIAYRRPL
jgi:ABC-type antimicrobial peptide transport system permease subunit